MTGRIILLMGLIAVCAGGYLWWQYEFPSASWRYKITVTVDTPEGLKSGYSVIEVMVKSAPEVQGLTGTRAFVKGEAVTVDLGVRGKLFAVLNGDFRRRDFGYGVVFDSFAGPPGLTKEGIEYYSNLRNASHVLEIKHYPILVTFSDINNPQTIKRVLPYNLGASFGNGVTLKSIQIEFTNDPITNGIEDILPWLKSRREMRGTLGGGNNDPINDSSALFLTGNDFIKGVFSDE